MTARILVAEDDGLESRRLQSTLLSLGYECVCVADGDAALARLAAETFDCVLLDLVLPGLDGMGVLGALRARGDAVPVVAAVTASGIDAAASALKAGARDFVVKPAGALRLQVALANAIALGAAAPRPAEPAQVIPFPAPSAEPGVLLLDRSGHARPLLQLEEDAIRAAVSLYGGRMSEVARRLGIGRSTLYRRLGTLGLGEAVEPSPLVVAAE